MKTVIIPANFSNESLNVAETFVRNTKEETHIIFTHLFHVPDDIQDLLFSNYRKREYDLVPEEFWRECKILKDLYSDRLMTIKIEFFYGNKLAAFKNFLEFHEVDVIAYSESMGVPKLGKSSMDAVPVIKKSGLPLVNTDMIGESAFTGLQSTR